MTDASETVDLYRHLPVLLFSLSAKISQHAQKNSARPLDMDMCEWRVIQILGRDGASNVNQVADRIAMDRGGISRAISRLEKRGFVDRRNDPDDRRRSAVFLSSSGQDLHKQIAQFTNQREADLKSCLSQKEQSDLFATLTKLDQQVEIMMGREQDPRKSQCG